MKRFGFKLTVFLGISIIPIVLFLWISAQDAYRDFIAYITESEEYGSGNVGSREIVPFIEKVQENNGYTKLIIGDSLCAQIYNPFQDINDEFCISGTNRAITLAGQYILAKEFIENHEKVTDIYIVCIIDSLRAEPDENFGYQYVVMPFTETDTIYALDKNTREKMESLYGSFFCRKWVVERIDKSPLNRKLYLTFLSEKSKVCESPFESDTMISETAYQYLEKMHQLCKENGVDLHLVPAPHADTEVQRTNVEYMKNEILDNGKEDLFGDYFDNIEYYQTDLLRDGVHFDETKIGSWRAYFAEIILKEGIPGFRVKE